jgi:hypothetical protein
MLQLSRISRDEMQASQSAANEGHFTELKQQRGRLLAWIRDQVRLKAFWPTKGLYIQEEAQPHANLKTIGKRKTIRLDTIAVSNSSQEQ